MHIRILAVGGRQPSWVNDAFDEYAARLPRQWRFELKALPSANRGKNSNVDTAIQSEGQAILKERHSSERLVALDERGDQFTSVALAKRLGEVLRIAHARGQRFDGWSEHFDYEGWLECFRQVGKDPYWYVYRERDHQEAFPWEVVSAGVDRSFLWRDWERASKEKVVPNCFTDDKCITCGIQAIAC